MFVPEIKPNLPAIQGVGTQDLTTGENLRGGFFEGVAHSIPGELGHLAEVYAPDVATAAGGLPIVPDPGQQPLSEADWQASKYWRPEMKYEPGMTQRRAELLAGEVDRRGQAAYVDSHWHGTWAGTTRVLGQIAGSALDPTNYIPMLGEVGLTAKLGPVVGRAVSGAVTVGALGAIGQGLGMASQADLQQDPDWHAAAINVGIAALMGGGIGALSGFFSRHTGAERATGTAKALDDAAQGKPIDVSPAFKPEEAGPGLGAGEFPVKESGPKPDFSTSVSHETPLPELAAVKTAAKPPEGTVDIGVSPERIAQVEARFRDLEANPATAHIVEGADVSAETKTLTDRAKAFTAAALCLAREIF